MANESVDAAGVVVEVGVTAADEGVASGYAMPARDARTSNPTARVRRDARLIKDFTVPIAGGHGVSVRSGVLVGG